jgi:hypothetical protein
MQHAFAAPFGLTLSPRMDSYLREETNISFLHSFPVYIEGAAPPSRECMARMVTPSLSSLSMARSGKGKFLDFGIRPIVSSGYNNILSGS